MVNKDENKEKEDMETTAQVVKKKRKRGRPRKRPKGYKRTARKVGRPKKDAPPTTPEQVTAKAKEIKAENSRNVWPPWGQAPAAPKQAPAEAAAAPDPWGQEDN